MLRTTLSLAMYMCMWYNDYIIIKRAITILSFKKTQGRPRGDSGDLCTSHYYTQTGSVCQLHPESVFVLTTPIQYICTNTQRVCVLAIWWHHSPAPRGPQIKQVILICILTSSPPPSHSEEQHPLSPVGDWVSWAAPSRNRRLILLGSSQENQ